MMMMMMMIINFPCPNGPDQWRIGMQKAYNKTTFLKMSRPDTTSLVISTVSFYAC